MSDGRRDDEPEIEEPPNSTVDDWTGQRIDRDTERAERIAEETHDPEEAERRFEEVSEDERPEDLPTEDRPG